MPFITTEQIQNISVKSVEMFLNDKVPLSEGLAKQASDLELNSEQIHRAVEATNSIAYLKIVSMGTDRTVEFPLCKYAEVMKSIMIPEEMSKVASTTEPTKPLHYEPAVEAFTPTEVSRHEYLMHFTKMAADNERELTNLRDRSITIVPELTKVAALVKADTQGLEKLATISEGKEFTMLSALVYGEPKQVPYCGLFKKAELVIAEELKELLKEASEIKAEITEREKLVERSSLVKAAVFNEAGDSLGNAIGGTIGGAGKTIGKGISNSASNTFNALKNKVKGTSLPTKKFGIGKVLGTAAGIGFDASLYSPGRDAATGTSKDIWTALQRE